MIKVRGLTRKFGNNTVLKAINFDVPAGRICGFVGPNGAGKTTTMRILATLDLPTSGTAIVDGVELQSNISHVRKKVGYMPDYYGTYSDLVVAEYLEFFARSSHLSVTERKTRLKHVADFTELQGLKNHPVEGLSKGQKQRLSLARTLLSDPELLILDEPAAGLDPRARIELRELLKVLASQGKTIFISSHILSELSDLIDWLVIIDQGKIKHSGPPSDTSTTNEQEHVFVIQVLADEKSHSEGEIPNYRAQRLLLETPGVSRVESTDDSLLVHLDLRRIQPADLLKQLIVADFRVAQFYKRALNLEDVFMKVTGS